MTPKAPPQWCNCGNARLGLHRIGCPNRRELVLGTVATVPNTPGTPRRTIRVPDALWDAAAEKAKSEDTDVSAVIRKALERYVRSKR